MNRAAILACLAACGGSTPAIAPPKACFPAATADAPLVVLYELNPASWSRLPTVAIWPDGEVMGIHAEFGDTTAGIGHISPELAGDIAREVRGDVAGMPLHTSISTATDEPSVRVVLRDGSDWRVVGVYGFTERSAEPAGMAAAVKRLLPVRERFAAKWVPPQWELRFEEYLPPPAGMADDQPAQEEMRPWPAGIAAPHATGDKVVIDAKQYPPVEALDGHPALRDGAAWRIDATGLYRGEKLVEQAERCARQLNP